MRTLQFGGQVVLCWLVFVYKVRHLWADRRNPFLAGYCISIATVATSVTLSVPGVQHALERATGILAIWAFAAVFVVYPVVLMTLLLWQHPMSVARRMMRPHFAFAAAVLLTMVVLDIFGSQERYLAQISIYAEQPEVLYGTTPYVREASLVYAVGMGFGTVCLAVQFWRQARIVDRRWLQRGLRWLAVGCWICLVDVAAFGVVIVGLRFGTLITLVQIAYPLTADLGYLTLAVASTMPIWGPWIDCWRGYRRLRPLWQALTRAHPDVRLDPPAWTRLDQWSPWRLHYRLYRRVVEIRDGLLALRPYMSPPEIAAGAVADPLIKQAAVTAAQIRTALGAHKAGQAPHELQIPYDGMGGEDMATELDWLLLVAYALDHPYRDYDSGRSAPGQPHDPIAGPMPATA
jgi:hypothetical protein